MYSMCIQTSLTIHLMTTGLPPSRGISQYSSGGSRVGMGGAENAVGYNHVKDAIIITQDSVALTSGLYVDHFTGWFTLQTT